MNWGSVSISWDIEFQDQWPFLNCMIIERRRRCASFVKWSQGDFIAQWVAKKRHCGKDCPSLKYEIWDRIWNVWEPPSFHVYHFEFWCMGDFLALYSEHKKGTLYHGLQKIVPAKSDLPILQDFAQLNTDQLQWNSLQFNLWQKKKLALISLEGLAAIFWQGKKSSPYWIPL